MGAIENKPLQKLRAFIKASNVLDNIFKCQIFYENVYLYQQN